jgi:hypothetical protein
MSNAASQHDLAKERSAAMRVRIHRQFILAAIFRRAWGSRGSAVEPRYEALIDRAYGSGFVGHGQHVGGDE